MKKLLKSLMLFAAAAMALTSCENEAMNEGIEANDTYTMTFVADAPQSRTSVSIEGEQANFAWTAGDKVGFYYTGTSVDYKKKGNATATIAANGTATFTASFESKEGETSYNIAAFYPSESWGTHATTNYFNNVNVKVPASQALTEGSFDPAADLMMSKPFMGVALNSNTTKVLEFARLVAVGKMNLKLEGMVDGEVIKEVKLTFANHTLNGDVVLDMENGTYKLGATTSKTVTLSGELAANADRTAIFFTCLPGEFSGAYTINVTTDKATYEKEATITKALSFTAGDVLGFNATVGNREEFKVEAGVVVDVLNRALTGITATSYSAWSGKTSNSDAVYAGQSAGGNSSIQLRSSNNNSGIVTTASGGKATKVVVTWNSNTSSGRTLDIYGKNSAYTNPTELYAATTQGTKLGSIKYGTSTELVINGNYEFIGMRSADGAMYLSEIEIHWAIEDDGLAAQTLEFSEESVTYKMGGEFSEPELTGAKTTVTYASSNEAVATVDNEGKVTFVGGFGDVIITATAAEENGYREAKASYTIKVEQASIEAITIAAFAAKDVDASTYYRISGTIKNVKDTNYGNFDLVDETGKIYVYGLYESKGTSNKMWAKAGCKEGDFLTIEATVGEYSGSKQAVNAYYISHYGLSATTPAEAVSYEGGEASFTVTLPEGVEGTLSATCADEFVNDWDVNGNTVTVVFNENVESGMRTATINVTYGKVFTTVQINQSGKPSEGGDGPALVETTASLSFANKAQRTTFTTSQQIWEQNGVKFTNDKASSSNAVADYANPARLYAGSKVTVEVPGSNITKIVFDCNSSSYATAMKSSIGTVSGATVSVSSDKVTVTFTNAVESFVVTKLTAQVRIDSITVTSVK